MSQFSSRIWWVEPKVSPKVKWVESMKICQKRFGVHFLELFSVNARFTNKRHLSLRTWSRLQWIDSSCESVRTEGLESRSKSLTCNKMIKKTLKICLELFTVHSFFGKHKYKWNRFIYYYHTLEEIDKKQHSQYKALFTKTFKNSIFRSDYIME